MRGWLLFLVGCSSATMPQAQDSGSTDPPMMTTTMPPPAPMDASSKMDAPSKVDKDGDGFDDAQELWWAAEYFPYLSIHPSDGCARHGVLFRLSPHPKDSSKIAIWYDVLYETDCGANGHTGDNEAFGVIADPKKQGSQGILAVRAISHQSTPCERITTCGTCNGMSACDTAMRNGMSYPVLYPSKNKHGGYVKKSSCDLNIVCDFGGCALSSSPDAPSFVNAGEPGKPLTNDLTDNGFITAMNGWTKMELFHFDPWKAGDFGSAGDVSKDLVDPAFVIDCP
jgi:hypothetical protein